MSLTQLHAHVSRHLLASSSSGCDGEESHHSTDETFNHIYHVMLFVAILWVAGKLFARVGMPALVGEIVFGIVCGPHLLNLPGKLPIHPIGRSTQIAIP